MVRCGDVAALAHRLDAEPSHLHRVYNSETLLCVAAFHGALQTHAAASLPADTHMERVAVGTLAHMFRRH